MKFLLLSLLLCANTFASPVTTDYISSPDSALVIQSKQATLTLPSSKLNEALVSQSNAVLLSNKQLDSSDWSVLHQTGVYDYSVSGGATNAHIDLGLSLPANALIKNVIFDVITQPTSSSAGTPIGIGCVSDQDIFSDYLVSALSTGRYQGKVNGATSTMIKLSAATGCSINIKNTKLTAGKIAVFVEYAISQ